MARQLRIEYSGAVYHITSRGNARQLIFADDIDRHSFLEVLGSTVKRFHWVCHAYCLMDNHYHLLVETPIPNLSRGMRQLNGVYTQRFNRHHGQVGHLFQGRFKSILVEKETHLMELCRYIVLNPIAAKMVDSPLDYRWSSYKYTERAIKKPDFLFTDWLLDQFSSKRKIARKLYKEFVAEGCKENGYTPWKSVIGQIILGSDKFVNEIEERITEKNTTKETPKFQRHLGRPPLPELFLPIDLKDKKKRNEVIKIAHFSYGYTLKEIADIAGVHYTTISRIVNFKELKK